MSIPIPSRVIGEGGTRPEPDRALRRGERRSGVGGPASLLIPIPTPGPSSADEDRPPDRETPREPPMAGDGGGNGREGLDEDTDEGMAFEFDSSVRRRF